MIVEERNFLGKPVSSLQTMLRLVGTNHGIAAVARVIPDGIYGKQTEEAVRAFQRSAGLPVTGSVSFETWQQLVKEFQCCWVDQMQAAPLRIVLQPNQRILPGERNCHMCLIQSMLVTLSGFFDNMPAATMSGVNDAPTQKAVKFLKGCSCQSDDAVIDKQFYALLVQVYRSVVNDGTQSQAQK